MAKSGDPRASADVTNAQKAGAGAASIALAATVGMLMTWEGKVNDPHWDRYAKIHDVCYGETRVEMRHYSDAECKVMLVAGAEGFQKAVLKRNPRLVEDPYQLAAHTTFAYNLGVGTYNRSSVARLYQQGHEAAACRAIAAYRKAGGQVVTGLVLRRNGDPVRMGEVELCLLPYPGTP